MADLNELNRKAGQIKKSKEDAQLSAAVAKAIGPALQQLSTDLSERINSVAKKVEAIELLSPDTVTLGEAVEIKDPVTLTGLDKDETFQKILLGLQGIKESADAEPKSLLALIDSLRGMDALTEVATQLNNVYEQIVELSDAEMTIRLYSKGEVPPDQFIPVRLTNGENWYAATGGGGGGGGGLMYGEDINGGGMKAIAVVESSETPGVFSLAVASADGNAVGSTAAGRLMTDPYDYYSVAYTATTDTYTYKIGGSGGSTEGVVVITYTDSAKNEVTSAERTV